MDEWGEEDEDDVIYEYNRDFAGNNPNVVCVQLENRRAHVTLTRQEWKTLQRWLAHYDIEMKYKIGPSEYEHLPKKVIAVIEDWLAHRKRLVKGG